ncbi:polyprenyl synthetase family protein [Mycobacterium sp. CVI_P3]|uniref:Polyprenyl synthetase family protein n=1 Tax=Mycobacterium pinniadriaticum TaxID=2994102 RepID=A0ABT3SH86_9MYCO|nr:polyprenyl synthetase family protein [Mycobacterium pinniadriaticum]MCX2932484.1 polyprenyl synthetase family protein [Mycobacterium pinniadriaticum]MCX2938882.1 polyprenyl synthetase family protein [Mycobacterium pinniadriaticum]
MLSESASPSNAHLPLVDHFDSWRTDLRERIRTRVTEFMADRCADTLEECGVDTAGEMLLEFVSGGKCLRSTFMYLGWLCAAPPDNSALSASASLELVHAFALLQDDVMDDSPSRRGRPAAHVQLADWHAARGLAGSSRRFGESAAVLLGDLCLIWAERLLRESGLGADQLDRAWPRYDAMRTELAAGQFMDLALDIRKSPTLESVLRMARMKSGNYTVRRPLEIGAAMAGCDTAMLTRIGQYGLAVGEAFQLRDDILGTFGSPAETGKPTSGDLLERKATSVMVAAQQMAGPSIRDQFDELINSEHLDDADLERWRRLILATGAVQRIEGLIAQRVQSAQEALDGSGIAETTRAALLEMASICTCRVA